MSVVDAKKKGYSTSTSNGFSTSTSTKDSEHSSDSNGAEKDGLFGLKEAMLKRAHIEAEDLAVPTKYTKQEIAALSAEKAGEEREQWKKYSKTVNKLKSRSGKFFSKLDEKIESRQAHIKKLDLSINGAKANEIPAHPMIEVVGANRNVVAALNTAVDADLARDGSSFTLKAATVSKLISSFKSLLKADQTLPENIKTLAEKLITAGCNFNVLRNESLVSNELLSSASEAVSKFPEIAFSVSVRAAAETLKSDLTTAFASRAAPAAGEAPLPPMNVAEVMKAQIVVIAAFTLLSQASNVVVAPTVTRSHEIKKINREINTIEREIMLFRFYEQVKSEFFKNLDKSIEMSSAMIRRLGRVAKGAKPADAKKPVEADKNAKPVDAKKSAEATEKPSEVANKDAENKGYSLLTFVIIGISALVVVGAIFFMISKSA